MARGYPSISDFSLHKILDRPIAHNIQPMMIAFLTHHLVHPMRLIYYCANNQRALANYEYYSLWSGCSYYVIFDILWRKHTVKLCGKYVKKKG